jgi:hypothetical protein
MNFLLSFSWNNVEKTVFPSFFDTATVHAEKALQYAIGG